MTRPPRDSQVPELIGKTLEELKSVAAEAGLPAFAARQLADWLYIKRATEFSVMTNLSAAARAAMGERYRTGRYPPEQVSVSADGTKKYLYRAHGDRFVESAYIPDHERGTLCISTQIGCKMGCAFCMTGRQGFQGQLTAGEILNQLLSLPEFEAVTNLVYMGMGEPLDNLEPVLASLEAVTAPWGLAWSPRRVTVSTIGLIPAMREFLKRSRCHLAVSLHSPFDDERARLMPVQKAHPLAEVLGALRHFPLENQRRIFFEYILFEGMNDTPRHVRELARVLNGIRCRINLMRFHEIPGVDLRGSPEARLLEFQQALNEKGLIATIRRSRGRDIAAACGLLSTRARMKPASDRDTKG